MGNDSFPRYQGHQGQQGQQPNLGYKIEYPVSQPNISYKINKDNEKTQVITRPYGPNGENIYLNLPDGRKDIGYTSEDFGFE